MKISQKDLDLLVDSTLNEIYDRYYVQKEKMKVADKAWKEFIKTKNYKKIKEMFDTDFISYISIKADLYKGTPAESVSKTNYTSTLYCLDDLETNFKNRVASKTIIEYPSEIEVKNKLRTTLTIELIGGNDLKKALAEVVKTVKKQFKLS